MHRKILYNAVPRAVLLLVLVLLIGFHVWPKHSTGFRVRIASDKCDCGDARTIVLRVSANGELFRNQEPEGKGALARRLSEIYGTRNECVLYLSGDQNASYQNVIEAIEAIDAVPHMKRVPPRRDLPVPEALRTPGTDTSTMVIRLVTPGAVNAPCREDCYN